MSVGSVHIKYLCTVVEFTYRFCKMEIYFTILYSSDVTTSKYKNSHSLVRMTIP